MEQYINFIKTGDKNTIDGWLGQVDSAYVDGSSGITDDFYRQILRTYSMRFGEREMVKPYIHFVETGEQVDIERLLDILDTL